MQVIHAVGPIMRDYEEPNECFEVLQHTFYRCLSLASRQMLTSIAIPAISAGQL